MKSGAFRAGLAALVATLVASFAGLARAEPARVVVAVGSNHGLSHELPLQYAERDAERFANVMRELGGARPGAVQVLNSPNAGEFLSALAEANRKLSAEDTLVVYYSGHGSASALHLAGERLDLERLSAATRKAPAALRLVIIDACRDAVSHKGFVQARPFSISLGDASRHRGVVVMHSAGPGEVALESRQLHAGIFSHYLVSGLRGAADRDGDGRISVNEAYDFAYGRTLGQSSGARGSLQHPSLSTDIEGVGPLVLTRVAPSKSRLSLPAGRDVHYVVFEKGSQAEFAEAWGSPERGPELALPAGQFVVHQRSPERYAVAEVTLPFGGLRRLSREDFQEASAAELAARGGREGTSSHRLGAAFGLLLSSEGSPGEAFSLRYAHGASGWLPAASISLIRHQFAAAGNEVARQAAVLSLGIEHVSILGSVDLSAGLALAALIIDQELSDRFVRDRDLAVGLGPRASIAFSLPVTPQLAWQLGADLVAAWFREDRGASPDARDAALSPELALAVSTGIGFSF